jgi:hypothetical protein
MIELKNRKRKNKTEFDKLFEDNQKLRLKNRLLQNSIGKIIVKKTNFKQ